MATSSATNGGANIRASRVEDRELHVVTGPKLPAALNRKVVSLEGSCPAKIPLWPFATTTEYDRRQLRPLTLKYMARSEEYLCAFIQQQDAIRQEIWRSISKIAKEYGRPSSPLPVIVIRSDPLDVDNRYGAIELTFESTSKSLFACVQANMERLTIENVGREQRPKLSICHWSNSLEPNVMPFDILGLPVTSANSEAIFKSVKSMTASLGTVLGLGTLEITTVTDGMAHPRTDTARFYLQLTPASMKMSFSALIAAIPTHFVWHNMPHTLQYSGRQLHQVAKHSVDYPVQEEVSNADDSASSSTPSTSASTTSSSSTSVKVEGSNDSNKRKRK